MRRIVVPVLALLSVVTLLGGCAGAPSASAVRWELERRFPQARFETGAHIRLGRITLGLVRGIVRMVPGKVEGQEILNEIHRIEVATYKVHALPDLGTVARDFRFEDRLARDGWTMAVRARDADSQTWIFVRDDGAGALRNLFLVALDGDELTLVGVDGRLDRAVAEAMADHPRDVLRQVSDDDDEEKEDPSVGGS